MFRLVFLSEFGKAFVPKKLRPNLRKYLLKANISPIPYNFFGALFYFSTIITAIIYVFGIYPYLSGLSPFLIALLSFLLWILVQSGFVFLFIVILSFYIDMKIYFRMRQLEELLPDFLQVVSSNLKGGMSFENSLWAAIKPRFNILANEMAEVSKKVMTGYDVHQALFELSEKYGSPMLRRAVDLIISELESGGNVAELLDRIVGNMKKTKMIKADMAASVLSYILFISVIVIFIAPLLFALSYSLLLIISNFISKISLASGGMNSVAMQFQIGNVSIDTNNFKIFSMAALSVISFFSAIIVSIVEKGEVKAGIRYMPLFILGALSFYFLFMKILDVAFSGLYTF